MKIKSDKTLSRNRFKTWVLTVIKNLLDTKIKQNFRIKIKWQKKLRTLNPNIAIKYLITINLKNLINLTKNYICL